MWQTQAFSALTTRQLYEIYRLRVAVFVVEQTCPYQEVDEADVASLHISKWQGDQLLAYCRLIPWSDGVHLGRVVVQPDARGAGLGRELVSQALATAQQHFPNQPLHAQAQAHPELLGIQLFSRHLGKSWADPDFRPVFEAAAQHQVPIWLHPVFDSRKPDNNIIFSWEYEQTQAMLDLVQAGYFQDFPNLKVIVHHAGAMAPYFSGRIDHILPTAQAQDFRRFYVDTALLGNSKALELCVDFFGVDRVLFGTDAPLGLAPAGATELIATAIEAMPLSASDKQKIFSGNATTLFNLGDKR